MGIRSHTSRRKLQSITNMSSLTSCGIHKIASNMLNRPSTSMTLSTLMLSDPKIAALVLMAESVQKCDAFVSTKRICSCSKCL